MLSILKYIFGFFDSSLYVTDWLVVSKDIIFSNENDIKEFPSHGKRLLVPPYRHQSIP